METIEVSSALLVISLWGGGKGGWLRAQAPTFILYPRFIDVLASNAGQHQLDWRGKARGKVALDRVLSLCAETSVRLRCSSTALWARGWLLWCGGVVVTVAKHVAIVPLCQKQPSFIPVLVMLTKWL